MYLSFAIFDETTYAVIQAYFPNESSASGCLKVFNTWWTISNSKTQYSSHNYLGKAAVHGDKNVKMTDEGDAEKSEHLLHDVATLSSKLDTIFLSYCKTVHIVRFIVKKLKKNGKILRTFFLTEEIAGDKNPNFSCISFIRKPLDYSIYELSKLCLYRVCHTSFYCDNYIEVQFS